MAALPSPTQVAGNHGAIYEAYYNFVDPNGGGTIGAMEAARFLKKSGLSDVVLSKIWDLSDPGGRGCLDKTGMYIALKLVSLAQAGDSIKMANINKDMPPPKMGDIPMPKPKKPPLPSHAPLITSLPTSAVDWTVKPAEREKYEKLFHSLHPVEGMIPGNKVKGVLMDSKLPLDTLGKIWDLADQDKDGMLDKHEFIAAMHLVYKALEKYSIPNTLPPELMPPAKRKDSASMNTSLIGNLDGMKPRMPPPPMSSIPPMTAIPPAPITAPLIPTTHGAPPPRPVQSVQPTFNWVVSTEEKAKADALFVKSDVDKDGFVSGQEIKDVFLQSGVPQKILAHIWALCDINQSGKLNNEQFALAMWFVARCLTGVNPPPMLTPEMVPPSFRTNKPQEQSSTDNNNTTFSNPELEMVSKDIQELAKEKYALETEISQKEIDIRIKSGEIKSLQSELDTLAATLKQLENQKGEAMKRLGDLKAQVDKLRTQAAEQAEVISSQESELSSKKEQLEQLKAEETRLEQLKNDNTKTIAGLSNKLQSTQLTISQAKAMITQLQEQSRQIKDAITDCDTAIDTNDVSAVPDTALRIQPEFRDPEYKRIGMVNGDSQNGFGDKPDPFSNQNGHNAQNPSTGFQNDPFANDPFKGGDAFASDPFNNSGFGASTGDGFGSDPFNNFGTTTNKADPFNAFGDNKNTSVTPEPDKDAFGCDPFAVLHAPTRDGSAPGRPTSPSPALPPKKAKPPRPAPPRPQPPKFNANTQPDPFSSNADPFSSGGFADFANFDSKCLHRSFLPDINYALVRFPNVCRPPTSFYDPSPDLIVFSEKSSAPPTNPPIAAPRKPESVGKALEFTDDPFRNYRYEDPFNIAFDDEDETDDKGGATEDKFDPFSLGGRQSVPLPASAPSAASGRKSAPPISKNKLPDESEQIAWAAQDSLVLEEQRKQRQLQEQADLELAIALSKVDNKL
ncbi:epidermal growth factor receptor substrate 15-like 1 isoform X8 [Atheta coriaria]|uniref:epidermal growth factor receptor substrate 15-like 1 isoform X8 n=1 Tax=Dalotia coriaria TaxID=877792 RepID=UPI0031F3D045